MKYLITLLLVFTLGRSYGQLDGYSFVDEGMIFKLFEPRYISINTIGVSPDSILDANGFTIRLFSMDRVTFDQFGYQASHRFGFITEALSGFVIDMINGDDFTTGFKNSSTSLSDFILGWHNHVINVVSKEDFNIAAGAHWGIIFWLMNLIAQVAIAMK